jgi:hypothetical protein
MGNGCKTDMCVCRLDPSVHGVENLEAALSAFSVQAVADQLNGTLVDWATAVPHFSELPPEDQLMLLKAGTVLQYKSFFFKFILLFIGAALIGD